jgi:plastocyanin
MGRANRLKMKNVGLLLCGVLFAASSAPAQTAVVTGQVEIAGSAANGKKAEASNTVVWLTPASSQTVFKMAEQRTQPQLVQHNRAFEPHVLVVEVGTVVQFPNKDHFLHNVFSLFDGKRFDLGFYESGSSKTVRFDRAGVSFLFCNIHPEMTAAVVAVPTPYFSISDASGHVALTGVPDGDYVMHVWSEKSLPEQLKQHEKMVTISATQRTLPAVRIVENTTFSFAHKNKYGQDYVPPPTGSYDHPR